jgi:hypothetical protein
VAYVFPWRTGLCAFLKKIVRFVAVVGFDRVRTSETVVEASSDSDLDEDLG